jgi:hypothetical protein
MELIWGAVLVGCGIFISVYGTLLFRFVLAMIGFAVGFAGALTLTDGQDTGLRLLVGLVAGAIAAGILFGLVRLGLWIAGGIVGIVLALMVASLTNQLDGSGTVVSLLVVAAAVPGAYFGRRLDDWIIILASAGAGALLIVYGLLIWFQDRLGTDLTDPGRNLNENLTLVMVLALAAVSSLSQYNIVSLRRRLMR